MYQVFTPKRLRGICLFKESCSNHVCRLTKESGYQAGIKAFKFRIKNCRPNYFIMEKNGQVLLITAQNEVIEEEYIDKRIIMKEQTVTKL